MLLLRLVVSCGMAIGLCSSAIAVEHAPPPMKPGSPLPWHAGVQVSTYSNVNAFNGNLFTGIPIVSWSGIGPGLSFALFHNSANWNQTAGDAAWTGFFLGAGWSTSYSDRLILTGTPKVIWADGTTTTFTDAGIHYELQQDPSDPLIWRVKHKNQSYHEFTEFDDDVFRLTRVVDPQGYATTIDYEGFEFEEQLSWRIEKITASGRVLEFVYDTLAFAPGVKLIRIDSPGAEDLPFEGISSSGRSWHFGYTTDANNHTWFTQLDDPLGHRISLTYDHNCIPLSPCGKNFRGRITRITDKYAPVDPEDPEDWTDADVYSYAYWVTPSSIAGKLKRTCDPGCASACGGSHSCPRQEMTYAAASPGYFANTYKDRRGNDWLYFFNNSGTGQNLYPDGNLTDFIDPSGAAVNFFYDSDRNVTYITDYIHGYWYRDFDSNGNLIYAEDPLANSRTWTFDAFNNVTSYTDPEGNITRYYYDEAHEVFGGYCTHRPEVACELTCDGGANDADPCVHDGDCPGGSCEAQSSGCKRCQDGPNGGAPCTGSGDCPGSTCVQGTCIAYEKQPFLSQLLTRIVEPGASGNPPANQTPGNEETYPVTRLNYYVGAASNCYEIEEDRYNCHGHLKEIFDPNEVWTGFEYDLWGQLARYTEGRFTATVATFLMGDQCHPIEDSTGCHRQGGSSGGACSSSECDAGGNQTENVPAEECINSESPGSPLVADPYVPPLFPIRPCDAPALPKLEKRFDGATYSPKGDLTFLPLEVVPDGEISARAREFTSAIDEDAGTFEVNASVASKEFSSGHFVTRSFGHTLNQTTGTYSRTGPDNVETYVELDAANRVSCMRRGPTTGDGPIMEAEFVYLYGTDLVESITYGNEVTAAYTYDDARRLTQIDYRNDFSGILLVLEYTYTDDDLPETIEETWPSSTATTTYTYDNRRRLIRELRTGWNAYDLEYEYDAGGNRTAKIDNAADKVTRYHYDTLGDDADAWEPGDYMSSYNRLEYYEVFDVDGETEALESTTWYYYYDDDGSTWGNPKRIVTHHEAEPDVYHSIRFGYAHDRRTVSFVIGEQWEWDGEDECEVEDSYDILWAREFRYDSGRARYLSRELNTSQLELGNIVVISDTWTDYDGDTTYGDFSVSGSPPTATNVLSYQPGVAETVSWVDEGSDDTVYQLTDHLGTVRGYSNFGAALADPAVYTAFGEKVDGESHRYGYVGAFGYQEHTQFSFLHVGERYYDPSTGRFLQRDPIGFSGGLNVYIYVGNRPTGFSDPLGLFAVDSACMGAMQGALLGYKGGPIGILGGALAGFVFGGYQTGDFDRLYNSITGPYDGPGWWDEFAYQDDNTVTFFPPPLSSPPCLPGTPFCDPGFNTPPRGPYIPGREFRRNPNPRYCD